MTSVPPPPGDVPPPAGGSTPYGSTPYGSTPPPAYSPGSGGEGEKKGLSLAAFIVGIAGLLLLSWVPILGLFVGVVPVILGFMAKKREPHAPKWMWIVGIIAGFLSIVVCLFITFSAFLLYSALTSGGYTVAP